MKNTFGNSITLTLFGESHGPKIGAVLDGLTPGLTVDETSIARALSLRRPSGEISTARRESDLFEIVSGVKDGLTTGAPLCLIIANENTRSGDYAALENKARPSHADYAAHVKYHGFEDARGGGHFSGRITAAIVAVGQILRDALKKKGIVIGTHILSVNDVKDRSFDESNFLADIQLVNGEYFAVLDKEQGEKMQARILESKSACDSVGGVLETAVIGLPAGVGEPFFDSVESVLSHALFSIGGVKGVEFGAGFAAAQMRGSEANDELRVEDGKIITKTNHSGGVNGGITNGMPVVFRCAVKPTPSIARAQQSVDFSTMQNVTIETHGRHDPCIVHRVRAVVDAMTAIVLSDMLCVRFGTDYLRS